MLMGRFDRKWILKVLDILEWSQKSFCVLMLCGIVIATVLQIFSRYILQHPYMWTEELARTLGIWLVMVGAGVVLKNDGHIGLNLISERLQAYRRILTHLIVLTFSILVILPAMSHVGISLGRLSMAMRIPLMILYAAMPVGIINLLLWSAFGITDEIIKLVCKDDKGALIP